MFSPAWQPPFEGLCFSQPSLAFFAVWYRNMRSPRTHTPLVANPPAKHLVLCHKAELSRVHPSAFLDHSFPDTQTIFEWFHKPPPPPKKTTIEEKERIDFITRKKEFWRALRVRRAIAKAQSPLDKRQIEKDMTCRYVVCLGQEECGRRFISEVIITIRSIV